MTRLVLRHLVDGIVDRVIAELLRALCDRELALACARFSRCAHLEVLFGGVGHDFAQKFRKLCCVLRFLVSIALVSLCDLGIALALSDTRHCKVHTDLGALAREVCAQTLHDFLVLDDAVTDVVLAGIGGLVRNGRKRLCVADGAFHHIIGDDLAANSTSLHKSYISFFDLGCIIS